MALRILEELEAKSLSASNESGTQAFAQGQVPADSDGAANEGERQAIGGARSRPQAISSEGDAGNETKTGEAIENPCDEESDRNLSEIFELAEPHDAEAGLAASFKQNIHFLDLSLRYRTNRQNAYLKKLHELQRLQAGRRGDAVTPPLAVDLTVDANGDTGRRR